MFNLLFLIAHAAEATIEPINPNLPGVTPGPGGIIGPLELIGGFYKFALAISGFLAMAVIVYGAIKYATNAGNAGNLADAKEWIYSALLGILLLAGAYILLYTIGGPQLTVLRLPSLQKITAPTISPPSATTVYAVVEKKTYGTDYKDEAECKTTGACSESGRSCVKNRSGTTWSCVGEEKVPLPTLSCFRDLNACTAKKNELTQQNPSKFYDCMRVDVDRPKWCSSAGLQPVTPSVGWSYDSIVTANITPAMLNANPGNLCPKYASVDKNQFWLSLVKSISQAESSWNYLNRTPDPGVNNGKPDEVTGLPVYSEGLLQLSYQDAKTYRNSVSDCTRIDWTYDKGKPLINRTILNPEINLSCGMGIMDYLLRRDGPDVVRGPGCDPSHPKRWCSMSAYWEVLRPGQDTNMRAELKQEMPSCY